MHGTVHGPVGVDGSDVIVGRGDVELGRPGKVVKRLEKAHEIGRDRQLRAAASEHGPFFERTSSKKCFAAEAAIVEILSRVAKGGRHPGRDYLGKVSVALAPERRPPGLVKPATEP